MKRSTRRKNDRTTSGLSVAVGPLAAGDLARSLHHRLRAAITSGRIVAGTRLPSTRRLASELRVSRNTVLAAYDRLLSDGLIVGRRGSGTTVAETGIVQPPRRGGCNDQRLSGLIVRPWREALILPNRDADATYRFDFGVGHPDVSTFPFDVWRRLYLRVVRQGAANSYLEPQGVFELRDAIAKHVSFTRAIACSADDIVVTGGAQQAFDLIARVLVEPGRTSIAVENPGYPPAWRAFRQAGARLQPIEIDSEGLLVASLPRECRLIYTTPSHQFPLGPTLTLRRRSALIEHAKRWNAVVVEDDYDGEFAHRGTPVDALKTLDWDGRVIYVGTFSKSMFPALRLGFVIAPTWLREALVAARQATDWHSSGLEQRTLASFIAEGHLARHVRRMRRIYAGRHGTIRKAITGRLESIGQVMPTTAGLHVAVLIPAQSDVRRTVAAASANGVRIAELAAYALGRPKRLGIALGFGGIRQEDVEVAVGALTRWK